MNVSSKGSVEKLILNGLELFDLFYFVLVTQFAVYVPKKANLKK